MNEALQEDAARNALKLGIFIIGGIALLLGLLGLVIRSATAPGRKRKRDEWANAEADRIIAARLLQPGRFKVIGVDRESKLDTSGFYQADNAANARAKAELDGMVVTDVKPVLDAREAANLVK